MEILDKIRNFKSQRIKSAQKLESLTGGGKAPPLPLPLGGPGGGGGAYAP